MPNVKQLIRKLAEYAMAKRGACQDSSWCNFDVLEFPHVGLPGISWGTFFEEDSNPSEQFARFPVSTGALAQHHARHPVIRESAWMPRDGHTYMEVPLAADIPFDFFKALIDEAYQLVWNKLPADARMRIELGKQKYDEPKLMDRLIESHGLKKQAKAIRKLARPALLLRTKKTPEAKIPVGATKIGGRPDLPAKADWPNYRSGKPLAFLAQLNLAEIAKKGAPIKGLPASGLLSVFSVWGWMAEDSADPMIPNDNTEPCQEEIGWTVTILTPKDEKLLRRKSPAGVNSFKPAAVELTPILSLPNHAEEPALAALGLDDDVLERLDSMQSDYRSIQMGHWLGQGDSFASHHLVGGYALFQQDFPEEVLEKGLAMFLQIGTDGITEMCWGDGGELTFYADAKALAKGRFERIWGTCQGG